MCVPTIKIVNQEALVRLREQIAVRAATTTQATTIGEPSDVAEDRLAELEAAVLRASSRRRSLRPAPRQDAEAQLDRAANPPFSDPRRSISNQGAARQMYHQVTLGIGPNPFNREGEEDEPYWPIHYDWKRWLGRKKKD